MHPDPFRLVPFLLLAGLSTGPVSTQEPPGTVRLVVPQRGVFGGGRGAVRIEKVAARVAILEGTARTTLQVDLRNEGARREEGVLLVPVPARAVVSGFAFEGAAAEPTARILAADRARRIYEDVVRRLRDPALLEFAGDRALRTSIFPIPAGGRQRLRITYEHVLDVDGQRYDYALPRSEALDQRVGWEIHVTLHSPRPIAAIYSPSHELIVRRHGPRRAEIRLAPSARTKPGSFLLSWLCEAGEGPSASFFAHPDPAAGGGYFLLLAGAPPAPSAGEHIRREVTIVLDRSGSMAGEKLRQVRAAARQVLANLELCEHLNVIDYATTVERFASRPLEKHPDTLGEVERYLAGLRPIGGTNLHDALLEALRQPHREGTLGLVLFLTDGLPTVGKTGERAIREMVAAANVHGRRVFTFGVGGDVNAPLLDAIAEDTRAVSTYVLPGEDVEVKVGRLWQKLRGPVLEDVELRTVDSNGATTTRRVRDLHPRRMPDLFAKDTLVVLGRYVGAQPIRFELSGRRGSERRRYAFTFDPAKASVRNAFVARLWGARRIAHLVDLVRQSGATATPGLAGADALADPRLAEVRDEILRLSTELGIVTEYTSFLATEGTSLRDWDALAAGCARELGAKAVATRSGWGAVNQALNLDRYGKKQSVLNPRNCWIDDKLQRVETATVQQIGGSAFFKRGRRWVDGRIVATRNFEAQRTIQLGSPEYLKLVDELSRLGRAGCLSLEGEILLRHDGHTLKIVGR